MGIPRVKIVFLMLLPTVLDCTHSCLNLPLEGTFAVIFGHAPDGASDPEWAVLPNKREGKWRLLKLGTTATNSRYSTGDDSKHKGHHFESLHKICFYDAWRVNPILGRAGSALHLPMRAEQLREGCYQLT